MTDTHRISACRLCGDSSLTSILDLGYQEMTGVFPQDAAEDVGGGQLELVWCTSCHLVQLAHSFALDEMYGDNYGYRSGLNKSMVEHLTRKSAQLAELANLQAGDLVLDIGANDATLLKSYEVDGISRLGIDPTIEKWREFYTPEVTGVADFFNEKVFKAHADQSAKIVTSIAMFYDLEDPVSFARDIRASLRPDGIWHFEQSYMPSMLRATSYDTVCHEHLEYYSLSTVRRILDDAGFNLLDVRFNRINGGSFAVTASPELEPTAHQRHIVDWYARQEQRLGIDALPVFEEFDRRVLQHRDDLVDLVRMLRRDGATVAGYGASTKGNVLLQYCGFTPDDIDVIAEVNPDKFGRVTPGTHIPIASEADVRASKPDYMLVLPWHFRENILAREADYLRSGGRLIFPLPEIEIVGD